MGALNAAHVWTGSEQQKFWKNNLIFLTSENTCKNHKFESLLVQVFRMIVIIVGMRMMMVVMVMLMMTMFTEQAI